MDGLAQRLKEALVRNILNVKQDKLDVHYITGGQGTFTRRELAKEIEEETEVGIRQMEMILRLTLDLVNREKQTLN